MKWIFYVIVFVYMFYRAVYGKPNPEDPLKVEDVNYGENDFLNAGRYITVSCKTTIKNQKVEWYDPAGNVVPHGKGNRIFVQDHFVPAYRGRSPALVLTITSAEVEDSGLYFCRSGSDEKNVSICVLDPVEFVEPTNEVTFDLGRSVTLSCPAKGNPEPKFVWIRNGENVIDEKSSSKYKIMTNYITEGYHGLLTITSLEPEDSGQYTCLATQITPQYDGCGHVNILNITLHVRHAPIFDDTDTPVYAQNNRPVNLQCSANAYPEATYEWFKVGKDTTLMKLNDANLESVGDRNQSVLTVNPGTTFGQKYKCQATNEYGSSDKTFILMKTERPSLPNKVTLINATHDSLELNITWDGETLFPVYGVDFQYMKEQRESSERNPPEGTAWRKNRPTERTLDVDEEVTLNADWRAIIVTLDNLAEETDYWVRVRAVNTAGGSPWSAPILASTVAQEEPEAEKENENEQDQEQDVVAKAEETVAGVDDNTNESTFYGIFFAGGILVVAVVCMFALRMVK